MESKAMPTSRAFATTGDGAALNWSYSLWTISQVEEALSSTMCSVAIDRVSGLVAWWSMNTFGAPEDTTASLQSSS